MSVTTKVILDGCVYARTVNSNGTEVVEKADPRFEHDAPSGVESGTSIVVTFVMRDFDGAERTDSEGTLLLDVGGEAVPLTVTDGRAEVEFELYESVTIEQRPPYFCDARMSPFTVEVTS